MAGEDEVLRRNRRSHKVCGDAELAVDINSSAQKPPPGTGIQRPDAAVSGSRFPPANTLLATAAMAGRRRDSHEKRDSHWRTGVEGEVILARE